MDSTFEHPFQNPDLPEEERIDSLIGLLTLDEKIDSLRTTNTYPRLGIRGSGHLEGIHGLSLGGPRNRNRDDFRYVSTTSFPQGIGLAATWDPELIRQCAEAEAIEARYVYNTMEEHASLIVMSPNSDLARDPRWGRTEECYGEDPYLAGVMTNAFVRGLQGSHPRYWMTASLLKHFLANSNEDGRDWSSSDFDERLWREYYSVPFRMGIMEAGACCYMAAYNSWNGIPCGVHPMIKDVTVDEWGTDGIICTDGGAVHLLVTAHKYYADMPTALQATLQMGITKYLERFRADIEKAIAEGLISEADLDKAIRPNLRVLIRLGLLDPPELVPYTSIAGPAAPWESEEHKRLALQATLESIVLLKNDGLLPLDRTALTSIAVIGPKADKVFLDWYNSQPPYMITTLDGIQARGARAPLPAASGPQILYAKDNQAGAAAKLARECDVAIVCVGNDPISGDDKGWAKIDLPSEGREAVDRQSITLEEEELVKQVFAANPRTVLILHSSFPYAINWSQEHLPAILQLAHSSQEQGNAVADVLFGDYNPAGRLVQTWPTSLEQLPPMMDYDIRHGRTYLYSEAEPLYPFGFGLSYTTFEYSGIVVDTDEIPFGGIVNVSVVVSNTGERDGDEVVQLYVRHLGSSVSRPLKELRGFERVHLAAGESKTVTIPIEGPKLAYWDEHAHQWVVEAGSIEIQVGGSSVDVRLSTQVAVAGGRLSASSSLMAG